MNKKIIKISSVVLMIIMLVSVATTVFATGGIQPNSISGNFSNTGAITNLGGRIVGILQTVGVVLSVVVLIVLGIKYMMGSAEEKAEYKKTMLPYIVGAALIFAASAFAQVIYGFFEGFTV